MSYDISITKTKEISLESLLNEINQKDIEIGYSELESTKENLNGFLNLYRNNYSTRGATVNTSKNSHTVIINAVASFEDFVLARDISIAISRLSNSLINTESEEHELTVEEFNSKFSDNWINKIKTGSASTFKEAVKIKGEWLNLPCCVRPFYFGEFTISEIDSENEDEFYESLCNRIKKVQYLDTNKIRIPEIGQFKGDESTLIIFNKEKNQFIPKVDFIFINDGDILKIPKSEFQNTKSILLERLDDEQYIALDIKPKNFENLKLEFQRYIQQTEKKQPKKKKWKFW